MDVSYPISITGVAPNDLEGKLYERSENADHGYYPVGRNHFWHGGVHFCGEDQLHAVADGLVVAYRLNDTNRPYEGPPYPPAGENPTYSNGFVLIKHEFSTPKNVRIPFYSLYMHLKAMNERYFKVKKYTPFEGYILAAEDESTAVFSRAAVSSGRRAGASAFPLVDKDRKAAGKTIKAHEFFTFEETKKGDFSRDYRYERVL